MTTSPASSSRWLSYEAASAWYRAEGVTTQAELNERAKQGLPAGIPAAPSQVYPEEFKNGGLGRFLGTERIANRDRKMVSYEEASAWYRAEGVTTREELNKRAKQGLPPGIPADPYYAYPEEFQDGGLGRFLGTGRIANRNQQMVSYEEASAWYRAEGVTTREELNKRAKQGLPPGIPADPYKAYPEEFQDGGLGRFLGTGRIAVFNREWVSYEEASAWYQAEGVTNNAEITGRAKQGLPPGIPADPRAVYRGEFDKNGIAGFLNLKKMAGVSKIERALRYVLETLFEEPDSKTVVLRVQGVSGKVWRVDVVLNRIRIIVEYDGAFFHHTPENISRDQCKTKDLTEAGWTVVRLRGQRTHYRLPLIQSKLDLSLPENLSTIDQISLVIAHLKMLHSEGHLHLSSSDSLRLLAWSPQDIASFNFRKLLAAYDGWVSYEEASAWYRAEGVTTREELNKRAKQGLPPGIPADPYSAYPEEFKDGGLGRFLGTGRIAVFNREWVSYEEASAWYQAEGVTTKTELNERAKQGLPPGIPTNPSKVYSEEFQDGGLGRFLGTGRIAVFNREWVSYEEASAWYQAEGVTSYAELIARAKQGLPPGIPVDPYQGYPEEFKDGGLGRFLGTGRIANQNQQMVSYEEASAWYRAEGVTNQAELRERAKQGLPPGIPADPYNAYPDKFRDGGLGRFLGTGRFAAVIPNVTSAPQYLHGDKSAGVQEAPVTLQSIATSPVPYAPARGARKRFR